MPAAGAGIARPWGRRPIGVPTAPGSGRTVLAPLLATLFALLLVAPTATQKASVPETLPSIPHAVRFAVIGDSGTGDKRQYEVAEQLTQYYRRFPFDFVIMLGDNIYGSQRPQDFVQKFEQPYKVLLDAGVEFYAALGNHDNPPEVNYEPFNMNGRRYYTFSKGPVEFFVLDSNYMDPKQVEWLEQQLTRSGKPWKICYFHHPLYSSGDAHGSETDLRALVEPLFIRYGVSVVFAGHEHFYERVKPQNGIAYFTAGGSAKLRAGNIRETGMTAKGFDTDRSFMVAEIADDVMHFQTISRAGALVDAGTVPRREGSGAPTTTR
jgi:3',5'-cyclic AMP phosphodiesterase CpdA